MRSIFLCFSILFSYFLTLPAQAAAIYLLSRAPQVVIVAGAGGMYVGVASAAGKKLPERDSGNRQPSPNLHEPSGNGDGVAPNFEEGRRQPTSHDVDYGPHIDEGGNNRGGSDSSLFKQGQEKWNQMNAAQKAAALLLALGEENFSLPTMIQVETHLQQLLKFGVFTEDEIVMITEELKVIARSNGEISISLAALNKNPIPSDLIGAISNANSISRATARYLLILVGAQ